MRFLMLALFAVAALSAVPANAAMTRQIWDYGSNTAPTGGGFVLNQNIGGHVYGRVEGQSAVNANPNTYSFWNGSTDTDTLYGLAGDVNAWLSHDFGRNGPNGEYGTGDGTVFSMDKFEVLANANAGQVTTGPLSPYSFSVTFNLPNRRNAIQVNSGSAGLIGAFGESASEVMLQNLWGTGASRTGLNYSGEAGSILVGASMFLGEVFEKYKTGSTDWVYRFDSVTGIDLASTAAGQDTLNGFATPPPISYTGKYYYAGTTNAYFGMKHDSDVMGHALWNLQNAIGLAPTEAILYNALTTRFIAGETFGRAYTDLLASSDALYPSDHYSTITALLVPGNLNVVRNHLAGDYNHDGNVDSGDYDLWNLTKGQSGPGWLADGNDDNYVDPSTTGQDYLIWLNASPRTGGNAPEPSSIVLAVTGVFAILFVARRKK